MRQEVASWTVVALLCLLCAPSSSRTQKTMEVLKKENNEVTVVERLIPDNTGVYEWVPWGPRVLCSPGSYALAFQLKVEPIMLFGDFTALNGVKLFCLQWATGKLDVKLTSTVGSWGLWGDVFMCTAGFLAGMRMKVEQPWEAKGDKSAANNLAMECENGERMTGDGTDRGHWGKWQRCPQGSVICGLATQVMQPKLLSQDDLSLVSAAFYCCTV